MSKGRGREANHRERAAQGQGKGILKTRYTRWKGVYMFSLTVNKTKLKFTPSYKASVAMGLLSPFSHFLSFCVFLPLCLLRQGSHVGQAGFKLVL